MDFENRSVDERLRANMTEPGATGAIGDRSDQLPVILDLKSQRILAGNVLVDMGKPDNRNAAYFPTIRLGYRGHGIRHG